MIETIGQMTTSTKVHIRGIGFSYGLHRPTYWTGCGLAQIHPFEMDWESRDLYENAPGYVDIQDMYETLDDALDSETELCMGCYVSALRSKSDMEHRMCCNCGLPFGAPLAAPILGRPKPVRDADYPTICRWCKKQIESAGLDVIDVLARKATRTPRVRADLPLRCR